MSSQDEKRTTNRRGRRSPPRRNRSPDVRGRIRCSDCDLMFPSMDSLNEHLRNASHEPRDGGGTRDKSAGSRTDRQRRPDSRERRRRSNSREKRRRSNSREGRRRSNSKERRRRSNSTTRRRSNSKEREGISDSREKAALDKEKKPDPTPQNVPDNEKKPDPAPTGVPGMVPDHIRRSLCVLQDYINTKEREPLVGLQYILEYKVQVRFDKMDVKYYCEICETDSSVIPMVDHLCGFKHRKLYVAKEYPYILQTLFHVKEDKAVFMRRIAMGIEQEEGVKMYKTDSLIRTVPMMNVKSTEAKQSKRRTRWDPEGDRQKKMEQALDFLDSYEIDTEDDVATVTNLLEKMSAELKTHTDKLREEALFPAKVARAKGVATTIKRNAVITWMYQRHVIRVDKLRAKYNRNSQGVPFPPNHAPFPQWPPFLPFNQIHNIQMAGNTLHNQTTRLQIDPEDEDIQFLKNLMELLDILPDSVTDGDDSQMDTEFLLLLKSALLGKTENLEDMSVEQLMQLASLAQELVDLDELPQNTVAPKNPSALGDLNLTPLMQTGSMANSALPVSHAQIGPMMQMASTANNALSVANAQVGPMMQRAPTANIALPVANAQVGPMMQMASTANCTLPVANAQIGPMMQRIPMPNVALPAANAQVVPMMQRVPTANVALPVANAQVVPMMQRVPTANVALPGANAQAGPNPLQQIGVPLQNHQMNVNSLLPENRIVSQRDLLPGNSLGIPLEQTTYRHPYGELQPSTSQIVNDFGLEGHMAEKFVKKRRSRFDEVPTPMVNERTRERSSGTFSRRWDEPPPRNIPKPGVIREYMDEEAAYSSRVPLSLSNQRSEHQRFLDDRLIKDIQAQEIRPNFGGRTLASFDEPAWVDRDTDIRYAKRARLDNDDINMQSAEWGRRYPDESDTPGAVTPKLSADLLKRIRGKDLFTVSAILSEVADSPSSM